MIIQASDKVVDLFTNIIDSEDYEEFIARCVKGDFIDVDQTETIDPIILIENTIKMCIRNPGKNFYYIDVDVCRAYIPAANEEELINIVNSFKY